MTIQIDDGEFTRLHNTILEKLALARFTASEYRCLMFLFRMTYGWQKKEDAISLSQWATGTGIDPEKRQNVLRTLQALTAKGVIYSKPNGNNHAVTWGFNKNFDTWDASLFDVTVISPDNTSVMPDDNTAAQTVITEDNTSVISPDNKTVISPDNHQRKKENIKEIKEKEETHAGEPLAVAWRQAYQDEMPASLIEPFAKLKTTCAVAAIIHGIKAAAKSDSRNFKYIAECARNYIPPPPAVHGNGAVSYAVDLPGVHLMQPPERTTAPPPLPPPMAHDDPWAVALAELLPTIGGQSATWLTGSRCLASGELAGVPLYRVIVSHAAANVQWLTQQAEPAVRKKLSAILRQRILVEFVLAEMEPTA